MYKVNIPSGSASINIKVVKKENEIYHVVIYNRNNIDIIEPLLYSTKAISDNKQIHKSVTTNTQFLCKDDAEKMQPKGDSFDVVITHDMPKPHMAFGQVS
jgi:hypothetical protein